MTTRRTIGRTILTLLPALVACLPLPAQTFQRVVTNQTAGIVVSPEVFNQGQAQHLIVIAVTDTGLTCTPAGLEVGLQGSFDGATWVVFGETLEFSPTLLTATSGTYIRRGEGYYPRVRVESNATTPINCTINVWYSGTQQTVAPKYEPDAQAGGLRWYCTASVATADTEFIIVPAATPGQGSIVVHSLFIYSEGVRIFDIGYNTAGPVWVPLMTTLTLPADGHLVMPAAVTPWFQVPPNTVDGLKLKLYTGTTDTTACVSARYSLATNTLP